MSLILVSIQTSKEQSVLLEFSRGEKERKKERKGWRRGRDGWIEQEGVEG